MLSYIVNCLWALLAVLCGFALCDGSENPLPSPLSLPPSLNWDGNDGSWSTFVVQIGTPPQAVRLLPATGNVGIWPVINLGCHASDGSGCPGARGGLFDEDNSTTWENKGLYSLPLSPQHYLPFEGNGPTGFDNITLNWQGGGGLSLAHQVISGFAANDLYLGILGLSPLSVNITSTNDQFPSFLGTLSEKSLIPSTSYSYLAGASYYSYPISSFGSLTFGGYDSTRLDIEKNLTLSGGNDEYRPMLVGVESIISGSDTLLSAPIIASLDSLVSHIWLPVSACKAFESAFGIVWNEAYGLYILTDAQHSALLARNASITFTLSTGLSNSNQRLNITLPYAAFDLTTQASFEGNASFHYFPLKQASNDTQYVLGRTFLQEVYMIADYGRGDLNLYPAVYPESNVQSNIVTVCPANSTSCHDPRYPASSTKATIHKSKGTPTGAIVGAVVGILALLALGIFLALRFKRKRRQEAAELEASTGETGDKPELADTQQQVKYSELAGPGSGKYQLLHKQELDSSTASPVPRQEMEGGYTGIYERYEMPVEEHEIRPVDVKHPPHFEER